MGWNDSRISLLAPGWKMVSQEAPSGFHTASGERLRILDVERSDESGSLLFLPMPLCVGFGSAVLKSTNTRSRAIDFDGRTWRHFSPLRKASLLKSA